MGARARCDAPTDPPTYLAEYDQLTLARLLHRSGRPGRERAEQALALLDRVADAAQAGGRAGSLVEARLVRALAHHANGDADAAVADLAARPRRRRAGRLLPALPRRGTSRWPSCSGGRAPRSPQRPATHAEHLLAPPHATRPPHRRRARLPREEGLSERELEVLRLLATELSGPEIARQLFVSVNTLRTHTKHIFTKLDVNTRRAAVRRAAELGLL